MIGEKKKKIRRWKLDRGGSIRRVKRRKKKVSRSCRMR